MRQRTTKDNWKTNGRGGVFVSVTMIIALSQLGAMCVPKPPPPPVKTSLPVPALMVHDGKSELAHDGIKISITPIDGANFQDFPQIYKKLTWQEPVASGESVQQVERSANWSIVPIPAFQVRISNDTGHVVRLTRAVFRLQDNTGKTYRTFTSTMELLAWNHAAISRLAQATPLARAKMTQQVQSSVGTLQLLTHNLELLKGDNWSGYLVFNLGSTTYTDLMNSIERFTLRLAEIPIETDDAGKTTRTTEFSFAVDKTTKKIKAICPGGTKAPSWQVGCKPVR